MEFPRRTAFIQTCMFLTIDLKHFHFRLYDVRGISFANGAEEKAWSLRLTFSGEIGPLCAA